MACEKSKNWTIEQQIIPIERKILESRFEVRIGMSTACHSKFA
jgi:hypothetical protein